MRAITPAGGVTLGLFLSALIWAAILLIII